MNYLFSAFRQNREANEQDWDAKMTFWTECIEQYCKDNKTATIDSDQIATKFERNGVMPMGMNKVLKEMYRSGKLVLQSDFERSVEGTWLSWGANLFIQKPAMYAYNSLLKGTEKIPSGSYIHQDIMEDMAEKVLSRYCSLPSPPDNSAACIIEQSTFESAISDICGDEPTRHLVLLKLKKMKKVEAKILDDGCKVIKFASSKTVTVTTITETEIGVFRLQKTISALEEQLRILSIVIKEHHQQARDHVRQRLKTSAKNSLRKKKMSEQKLERTESTLNTLQELMEKIQSAKTDRMIIDAYRAGSSALKGTLKENNLTPETVDETISEVQEVMEMCNEINDTLVQGNKDIDDTINLDLDIDEETLEAELNALVTPQTNRQMDTTSSIQERKEPDVEENDFVANLPTVPATNPTMAFKAKKNMVTS